MAQETIDTPPPSASELVQAARARLASELRELPAWDMPQLWARVYSTVPQQAVSFGALVHLIRVAARCGEGRVVRELFVLLLERTEGLNRRWAEQTVLGTPGLRGTAGLAMREDLRQELTLRLWESVGLAGGEAWELFFQRSLSYAQRNTATAYMQQRGYWSRHPAKRRVVQPVVVQPVTAIATTSITIDSSSLAAVADGMQDQHLSDIQGMTSEAHMLRALETAAAGREFTTADLTDLRDLVARLPREQRIAIVLRHWEQASEVEIAETLGVTTRTVRNYLRRAHQRLREWYEGADALI